MSGKVTKERKQKALIKGYRIEKYGKKKATSVQDSQKPNYQGPNCQRPKVLQKYTKPAFVIGPIWSWNPGLVSFPDAASSHANTESESESSTSDCEDSTPTATQIPQYRRAGCCGQPQLALEGKITKCSTETCGKDNHNFELLLPLSKD
ncbi:hypothetical protein TWF481_010384 [Arthrobotrys musiformis]|uniref:Uncharacterized protein n=1 Tax=Arthrobotrys musiformis TaxID=47236 RepID=A0AAV9W1R5_9PEZI